MSTLGSANASGGKLAHSSLGLEGGSNALSVGNYLLSGDSPSGLLHDSIYLVGVVNGISLGDSSLIGGSTVSASVNGFTVTATYSDATSEWNVNVALPGLTTAYAVPNVNDYFDFVLPVSLPTNVNLIATSGTLARVRAGEGGSDGQGQIQASLSASAWAVFTPGEAAPLPGDTDGDGDVDGQDFLTIQRGFGEGPGATLSDGDVVHDGHVEEEDLSIWSDNYGSIYPQPTQLWAVPEPRIQVLLAIAILVIDWARGRDCRRSR